MTTTLLRPDSVILGLTVRDDASEAKPSTEIELPLAHDAGLQGQTLHGDTARQSPSRLVADTAIAEAPSGAQTGTADSGSSVGMTEDDTVCVLEVLAEMQRIIDRHLEKAETMQLKP